jgi:glutamine cyclotransferase
MKRNIKFLSFLIVFSYNSFAQVNGVSLYQTVNKQKAEVLLPCDTVFSFPVKDTYPTGIAWDGLFLWTSGCESHSIYKYSPTGLLIDSIPSPSNDYIGGGMVFDGKNLWVLAEQENKIYKVDTSSGLVIKQFIIPFDTNGYGITFDGSHLLATSYVSGDLFTIDTANGQIINNLIISKPVISLELIHDTLYGIQLVFSQLYKIDKNSGAILDSMNWCIPYPLDITWDGTYLWNISSNINNGGNQRAYKVNIGSLFTSINNLPIEDNIDLNLFPNPANVNLTVIADNRLLGSKYSIVSFTGENLLTGKILNKYTYIDIEQLKTGIYLFRTENITKKFIKRKE